MLDQNMAQAARQVVVAQQPLSRSRRTPRSLPLPVRRPILLIESRAVLVVSSCPQLPRSKICPPAANRGLLPAIYTTLLEYEIQNECLSGEVSLLQRVVGSSRRCRDPCATVSLRCFFWGVFLESKACPGLRLRGRLQNGTSVEDGRKDG